MPKGRYGQNVTKHLSFFDHDHFHFLRKNLRILSMFLMTVFEEGSKYLLLSVTEI